MGELLQFGMCIVNDICDTLLLPADIFFTFPPAGPQTKGLVKSLDFPTQLAKHDSISASATRNLFLRLSHAAGAGWGARGALSCDFSNPPVTLAHLAWHCGDGKGICRCRQHAIFNIEQDHSRVRILFFHGASQNAGQSSQKW